MLSCNDKDTITVTEQNDVEASFRTTINEVNTRATDTTWEVDDAIGIFALNEGEALSAESIYDGMDNIEYRNNAAGVTADFEAASTPIMFPGDGTKLDFVAYYPYTTAVTEDYLLPIDVAEQTPLSSIDVLYASAHNQNKHNPSVPLIFTHQLSQVAITLTAESGISLVDVEMILQNATTEGSMDLVDGTITLGTSQGSITPVIHMDEITNSAVATAILLPGQAMNDLNVQISLPDGKIYSWIPTESILTSNTRNRYALHLTHGKVEMVGNGAIIEDWGSGEIDEQEKLEPSEYGNREDISITLTVSEVEAEGGNSTLQVTVPEETAWTVSTQVDWITLGTPISATRSTQSFTGSADIEVTAAPNTERIPRAGVITLTLEEDNYTTAVIISQAAYVDPDAAIDLFFSEYVDGSDDNDYIEIFNGTGMEVDLSNYRIILYPAGTYSQRILPLSGILLNKEVLVLRNPKATLFTGTSIPGENEAVVFKGHDAITLEKKTDGDQSYSVIDIFGCIGEKPANGWTADGGYTTKGKTLRRKPFVRKGVTENPTEGFPTLATEWDLYDLDDISGLGSHSME